MLNMKRQILLSLLNNNNGLSSQELAKQLSVTPRTIRNNINELNGFFDHPVISYTKPYFIITNANKVIDYIKMRQSEPHYPNYPNDRLFLTYFSLYQSHHLKLDEIAEQLHAGRNEAKKAVRELRIILPVELQLSATKSGIWLKGDLIWQNYFLAKLATKRISRLVTNQYLRLIFKGRVSTKELKDYLIDLNQQVKNDYQLALNDRSLYILMIMHFLCDNQSDLIQKTEQFKAEFILVNHNNILALSNTGREIFAKLKNISVQNKNYLYQLSGNVANHLQLLQMHSQYFHLTSQTVKINNQIIACTNEDLKLFTPFQKQEENHTKKARIVLYDPNLTELAQYQDQLSALSNIYNNLIIKPTTNLFELDNLLHVNNQLIIFIAKKARLSLTDIPYHVQYVHLDDYAYLKVVQLLLKWNN